MEKLQINPLRPNGVHESRFINVRKNPFDTCKVEDVDNLRRKRRPTWWQNLSHYFSQFCEATGIHGFRYIGERGRFLLEKLIWTVVIIVVCSLCISLICKAYSKWVTSPVIVTFATTETSISKIPFPAITICPEVKCDPEVFNYTLVLMKKITEVELTEEENRYLEALSLVCDGFGTMLLKEINESSFNLTFDDDPVATLLEMYPDIDPLNVSSVKWLQNEYPIDTMLSGTFTSEGFCLSFNMLEIEEILVDAGKYASEHSLKDTRPKSWSLEGGYSTEDKTDTFPKRTFVSGLAGGFEYDMYINHSHLDYFCGEFLQGFKVTLHHPSELPNMDKYFRVPLDQAVYVGIKPRMITVSEMLRFYTPEARKCYFDHEKRLKYFKSYTQNSCLQECFSNYTLAECGCAAFYMPKDTSASICGAESLECLKKSKVNFLLDRTDSSNTSKVPPCVCLPSCTSLEYDVEISQSDWNWREMFEFFSRLGMRNWTSDYERIHFSRLAVFYKEMQFLSSERNELYGSVDFFASTGGLLGLFIGFSVTSLIEILYFLTLRLGCNISMFGRTFWSGKPKLVNGQ